MRVLVDRDLCQGHAECTVEAPTVFVLSEETGQVRVLDERPAAALADAVRAAVRYCPTHALSIEED
jgi:sterol 14-demethylase